MDFNVKQLKVGGYDFNFSYLVIAKNGDATIIDPTGNANIIIEEIKNSIINPRYILLTHGHLDHTQALGEVLSIFPAEIIAHPNNVEHGNIRIKDNMCLPFGENGEIKCIFTPGHSRDSVCYLFNNEALFSGDVIFVDSIGFCRSKEMFNSLNNKILPLSDDIMVYSGHDYGEVPYRTLGEEKRCNAFLQCKSLDEFKLKLRDLV